MTTRLARDLDHITALAEGEYVIGKSVTDRHVYATILRADDKIVVRRYNPTQLVATR